MTPETRAVRQEDEQRAFNFLAAMWPGKTVADVPAMMAAFARQEIAAEHKRCAEVCSEYNNALGIVAEILADTIRKLGGTE